MSAKDHCSPESPPAAPARSRSAFAGSLGGLLVGAAAAYAWRNRRKTLAA